MRDDGQPTSFTTSSEQNQATTDAEDASTEFAFVWMELKGHCSFMTSQLLNDGMNNQEAVERMRRSAQAIPDLIAKTEQLFYTQLFRQTNESFSNTTTAIDPLDSYLATSQEHHDEAFVDSVCGWDMDDNDKKPPPKEKDPPPTSSIASMDAGQLMDLLVRNAKRKRLEETSSPLDEILNKTSKHRRTATTITSSSASSTSTTTRISKRKLESYTASRVLDSRTGGNSTRTREYLIEFLELDEPMWLGRKHSSRDIRNMIDRYIVAQRSQSRRRHKYGDQAADSMNHPGTAGTYIVEKIVDHRMEYGRKKYRVRWEGYESSDDTWEYATKLRDDVPALIAAYEKARVKAKRLPKPQPTAKRKEMDPVKYRPFKGMNHEGRQEEKDWMPRKEPPVRRRRASLSDQDADNSDTDEEDESSSSDSSSSSETDELPDDEDSVFR